MECALPDIERKDLQVPDVNIPIFKVKQLESAIRL
jgi:hypothetical protein